MESLKGKAAIVTGAGKGIGRALCLALAAEGVHVGLISRTESDLISLKAELEALGVQAVYAAADISNIQSVHNAIGSIRQALGDIDILVNNAGIATFGNFLDLEPSEWEEQVKVNLFGPYYCIRAVLPQMIRRKSGDIINISSTAGLQGNALTSAYSASKFGLMGLSDSLMQEVRKHDIRVTALNPSTVVTSLAKNSNLIKDNADRLIQPEDFAELIISQLKLNRRVFVRNASLWATNPWL